MDELDKLYNALIRPTFEELTIIIANADNAHWNKSVSWPEFINLLKENHWTPDEWQGEDMSRMQRRPKFNH